MNVVTCIQLSEALSSLAGFIGQMSQMPVNSYVNKQHCRAAKAYHMLAIEHAYPAEKMKSWIKAQFKDITGVYRDNLLELAPEVRKQLRSRVKQEFQVTLPEGVIVKTVEDLVMIIRSAL